MQPGAEIIGELPIGEVLTVLESAMAENVLLLSPRDIELAELTASSAVTALPVDNLKNQEPTKVWRTTSPTDQYVDVTLAAAKACDAVAMSGFNMSASGVWRLRAYETAEDVGVSHVLDSGWQSVWPGGTKHTDPDWGPEVALLRIDNESAYRYWRVELSDPGAGMTYLDVGRLALGVAAQFTINCDIEAGLGFVANDVQQPNGYGQTFTDPRPYAQRQIDMPWSALGQQEASGIAMELSRLRGQAGDVFCFLDPAEITNFHRWSLQGLFAGRAQFVARPMWVTDDDGQSRMAFGFTFSLLQKL
jgi:hypothetical protein